MKTVDIQCISKMLSGLDSDSDERSRTDKSINYPSRRLLDVPVNLQLAKARRGCGSQK